MTFKEALSVANTKLELVGKLSMKGAILSEVIIVPSDPHEFTCFKKLYTNSLNAQESIVPFINSDVIVLGVFDKFRIPNEGVFLFSEI